jgi:hypothetical protein
MFLDAGVMRHQGVTITEAEMPASVRVAEVLTPPLGGTEIGAAGPVLTAARRLQSTAL